eukprot:s14_g9.t1
MSPRQPAPPDVPYADRSHQPPRKSACEFKIFSLHGTIPIDEQEQAFSPPSENVCHIFLASSIAESSVTLPKVRVVIDACLRRQLAAGRSEHGVRCLLTQWVSHAAASQRSGRAGRVFPGVAIRLVPRSFYMQQMAQYDPPEIEQAPLEKLYLNVLCCVVILEHVSVLPEAFGCYELPTVVSQRGHIDMPPVQGL